MKKPTKNDLFLALANPDSNGISRWVDVNEFKGKYATLFFGNGASWARKESTLAKKYNNEGVLFLTRQSLKLTTRME